MLNDKVRAKRQMPFLYRSLSAILLATSCPLTAATVAIAQDAAEIEELPEVKVIQENQPQQPVAAKKQKPATKSTASSAKSKPVKKAKAPPPGDMPEEASLPPADSLAVSGTPARRSGSLTVPNTDEARAELYRTPAAVDLVSDADYKNATPAATIKDALEYVPGLIVQPKWGDDTRLSIRGSGLSRNFHLRGIQLYMDGIPINTADGFGDFQELDPSAYRFIEVYKGASALRFGANALGGAINFVTPTGYDADLFGARVDIGSFGYHKLSVSSGGVYGAADYFITGTWQEADGYRQHSWGNSVRGSMNLGYRLSENVETRFYLNANSVDQRIPGSVIKQSALSQPKTAAAINVTNDWQRNIDTLRVGNKTTIRLTEGTTLEFGAFYTDRHLMHPIYLWLDYLYNDYGAFARLYDERRIAGHKNRFIAGVNLHNGDIDARRYLISANAKKGALIQHTNDDARNLSVYAENTFYLTERFAAVAGTQFLHAERDSKGLRGAMSGSSEFDIWSPKFGLLYEMTPSIQLFANISRSAEIPSFGENVSTGSSIYDAKAQRATTYEIGTRGSVDGFKWDVALYRSNIDNELLCVSPAANATSCAVLNADKTVHQGVELGTSVRLFDGIAITDGPRDALWLNAAYTFSDFHFDNDALYGDNQLPGAPRHFLRGELLYKHPSGIYFGPNVEWVPTAYFVDSANTLDTESYAIWGMKLGYDAGNWSAYVEGRNLSDEAYIASTGITNVANPATTNLFEPGTGRAIYAGVQMKW